MNISPKAIKVRNIWIGGTEPCICAPVVGEDDRKVLREAEEVCRKQPDLLEWRADFFGRLMTKSAYWRRPTGCGT